MNCCVNNLGRFSHNQVLDTGLLMPDEGDYNIHLEAANGNTFVLTKSLDGTETLKFEIGELNEQMVYTFTIQKPDGTNFSLNVCEKFKLQTLINTQINGCANPCDDSDDTSNYYS